MVNTAGQIAAVPGSSTQYVVSLRSPGVIPSFAGLALYDGATLIGKCDCGVSGGQSITFTDRSTFFGYNNDSSLFDLVRFSVGPTGITAGQDVTGLITGVGGMTITSNGGWIFALNGQTVSAATMTSVGSYDESGGEVISSINNLVIDSAAVLPDADGANVWFLRTVDHAALLDFDRTTFQLPRRSISLESVVDVSLGGASAFVRWSPTGLAFRTISAVYLVTVPN